MRSTPRLSVALLLALAPAAHAQIDIPVELEKQALVETIKAENWQDMLDRTAGMRARGLDLGTEILFFEGRGLLELGNPVAAEVKLNEYIQRSGGRGANYSTALGYLRDAGVERQRREAEHRAAVALEAEIEHWIESGVIGTVTEINTEWGYVRIRITDPARLKEPVHLLHDHEAVPFGALRKVSDEEYTAAFPKRGAPPTVGASVYRCCKPQ